MNKEEIKTFVKTNKTKILAGAGMIAGVALFMVVGKTTRTGEKGANLIEKFVGRNDVPVPADFETGEVTDLWLEGKYLNAIVEKVTVNDMGKLGKEFMKTGLLKDDTDVSMIIGFKQ